MRRADDQHHLAGFQLVCVLAMANVAFAPAAALSNQISFTAPADGIYDIQIGRSLMLKKLTNFDFINIGDEVYADAISCNLP